MAKPRGTELPREVLRFRERGTVSSSPPAVWRATFGMASAPTLTTRLPSRIGVFDSAAQSEPRGASVRPRADVGRRWSPSHAKRRRGWGRSRGGSVAGGGENPLGRFSSTLSKHLVGRLARLAVHARLGRPDELVDVGKPDDPSCSAPPAVWDLAREDAHPELGMRPGAVLGVSHRLGHRHRHRGTALVVVQAFRDLTDEAVARCLWRGAGHVDLGAVDEHPGEL